ncbi:hypothetical protein HPP92_006881 [Vanilla planifolia]|uniref:Uncharacterized protein n=1 Tax=Vanilla planifolia TaxID=51239 RepID=A0A835RGG2_VANPL|nr:hypothetical protein HPP92_006881 [Vanilla planifolia]
MRETQNKWTPASSINSTQEMPARASQCTHEKDTSSRAKYQGRATKAQCIVQRFVLFCQMVGQQTSAHLDKR